MRICILGDFCPGDESRTILESPIERTIDETTRRFIRDSDLSIVNLECPLTLSSKKFPKTGPNIKSRPEFADFLVNLGINLATLANNHIYDFGPNGLEDTLAVCCKAGLESVGAGLTVEESQKIWFRSYGEEKLAIINVAENEWCTATKHHGGAHPLDIIENTRAIRAAAKKCDYVLVIVHGGNEHCPYPSPNTVKRYRYFAESGASAVIAHHPHIIQGYEIYRGVPIVYSLGNFLFPMAKKGIYRTVFDTWTKGMGVRIDFPFNSPDCLKFLPFHQCHEKWQVVSYAKEEEAIFQVDIANLSAPIHNQNELSRLWKENLQDQADTLLWYLSFGSLPMQVVRKILSKIGLLGPLLRRKSRKNFLRLQIIRTEAHRDLILGVLDDLFLKKFID